MNSTDLIGCQSILVFKHHMHDQVLASSNENEIFAIKIEHPLYEPLGTGLSDFDDTLENN